MRLIVFYRHVVSAQMPVPQVRDDILVARGKATKERNPGLGMLNDEPSAREFSEMSLSAFRTEGAEVGRGLYRDETRVSRVFSGFQPDRRVFLHIPEALLSGCDYFLRPSADGLCQSWL